jgi:hypothetical protein
MQCTDVTRTACSHAGGRRRGKAGLSPQVWFWLAGSALACLLLAAPDLVVAGEGPKKPADKAEVAKGPPQEMEGLVPPPLKRYFPKSKKVLNRVLKLKTVRLKGTASFAKASNVNDIMILWCWEPKITIRLEEEQDLPAKLRDRARKVSQKDLEAAFTKLIQGTTARQQLDPETARRFEKEAWQLVRRREFRPFFHNIILIEQDQVSALFNDRVPLPLKGNRGSEARNLSFALSVSNLVPLVRHAFKVENGPDAVVKDMDCRHVKASDRTGVELDLYFDKRTDNLVKIAHWGHGERAGVGKARWDHFFSRYQEKEGLKQWQKLQIWRDGKEFATIEVSGVEYFDELLPELKAVGKKLAPTPKDPPKEVGPKPKEVGPKQKDPGPKQKEVGPKQKEKGSSAENKAAALLEGARAAIKAGNAGLARVRLRIILNEHPRTAAAKEAAKLLVELEQK